MDVPIKSVALSWRDPDGFVVRDQGRILRAVCLEKAAQTKSLIAAPWMAGLVAEGVVPKTVELAHPPLLVDEPQQWFWLEHETLAFPIYPHEITALQLFDAAKLTLRVALLAAENGWTLKDASAWNVLFSRGRPVFVDFLSFDRQPATGSWIAYGQFVRHFLLPLLLHRRLGVTPAEIFLTDRDGIRPERAASLLTWAGLVSPTGLELVLLPTWLSGSGTRLIEEESAGRKVRRFAPDVAQSLLLRSLHRLQRLLERLRPDGERSRSAWAGYEIERAHYSEPDLVCKREFVREHLGDSRSVLDLGANAGEFSRLAAERGSEVVAADSDHAALLRLYARVQAEATLITPLLLNIARPTPAIGWENREVESFLDRAAGQFDCVLVLGLLHHLLVSERATLPMLLDLLVRINPSRIILEWIDPSDPKFRQLAGLNAALYRNLDAAALESHFARKFRLIAKVPLPSAPRIMYHWSR